jgi:hypothetical protein
MFGLRWDVIKISSERRKLRSLGSSDGEPPPQLKSCRGAVDRQGLVAQSFGDGISIYNQTKLLAHTRAEADFDVLVWIIDIPMGLINRNRNRSTQLPSSRTDDEGRRAAPRNSRLLSLIACARPAADSACPSPESREFGLRDNS